MNQMLHYGKACLQNQKQQLHRKPDPNCPVAESLPQEVKDSAMQVEGIKEVNLDLVFEPPWEKSMMSEAARLELNL